jgi:hypothetical protein
MTTEQILGLILLLVAYSGISLYFALLEAIRYYRVKKAANKQQPTALLGVVAPPKRKRD